MIEHMVSDFLTVMTVCNLIVVDDEVSYRIHSVSARPHAGRFMTWHPDAISALPKLERDFCLKSSWHYSSNSPLSIWICTNLSLPFLLV